ncbi:MAG: ACP S-malonyltransferase, partial [Chloroflexia bacterium]|nr:ACP S-malonyltransferase [Chloroflexia bacterium]
LDLLPLRLVILRDTGLPISSNDREVWRFAQAQQMVLLTGNRRMRGRDSLEQTIREENTAISLPVLTIGSVDRLDERVYRERCASRIIEILLDIANYRGAGRIFIP